MTRLLASVTLPLVALAVSTLPEAVRAQAAQDFQLPPNPTPSPSPNVQGPVETESEPVTPRATVQPLPSPSPAPSRAVTPRQTATPTAGPTPALRLPAPAPPPIQSPVPTRVPRPQPSAVETPALPTAPAPTPLPSPEAPPIELPTDSAPGEDAFSTPSAAPTGSPIENAPVEGAPEEAPTDGTEPWWWIAALLALIGIGAAFLWKRRQANAPPPKIEPPRVHRQTAQPAQAGPDTGPTAPVAPTAPAPAPAAPPAQAPAAPLPAMTEATNGTPFGVRFEPLRLSRSVMAATLYYRVTILNRGPSALSEVVLEADLGSASGARPVDQQVLGENTPLTPRQVFGRLATGQSARFEGSVQIPLAKADVIHQGNTALLVPLMRLRATARDAMPFARTFAVGQVADNGSSRLQPFRLDEGLRSWEPLAQRALDRAPPTA